MKKLAVITFLLLGTFSFAQRGNYALAENYFRNNEFEKALIIYKELVRKSPYNTTYLKRLITCYQEIKKFNEAENLLKRKLKQRPNLIFISVFLGYNFERQQRTEQAQTHYNVALESVNKNTQYGATVANIFQGYNKLDLAIKTYQIIEKKNPKASYGFQIAQIYGEKGEFKKMFDSYIDLLDKKPNYLATVKRYAAKYITDDSENENNILFRKALLRRSASNPKNEWNDLLSWLFTKQKDYDKAFIQQKALYTRNPNFLSKIQVLGTIAFQNKDYEVAKECFSFFIEKTNYPKEKFKAISMNLQIAIATKQPNIEQQFKAIFDEYGINSNTLGIQLTYADYLTFNKNSPELARNVLRKALKFAKTKYSKALTKIKLADVLVYKGEFNRALIYFSQVQSQLKNHELAQKARFKVAQTSYFKNDYKWAKAQLKILKGSATQLIANDAADLFLIISENQPKDSLSTGLKGYSKADLLTYQNKNDEAISVLKEVILKFKGQPIEDEALFKQAEIFTKKEQFENAISNYENIIELDKEGILVDNSLYNLAEIYNKKLKNIEKAKEYYQRIVFDYPSSIYLVEARKKYRKLRGDKAP